MAFQKEWEWQILEPKQYTATLKDRLRINENDQLFRGTGSGRTRGNGYLYVEDKKEGLDRLAIGYGYDLTSRSYDQVEKEFLAAKIVLSASYKQALKEYFANGKTNPVETKNKLLNFKVAENQASLLLDNDIPKFENAVSNTLSVGVPLSNERIALVSLAYNNPSLLSTYLKQTLEISNRPGAWIEIRYFLNGNRDDKNIAEGLQNRRNEESKLFGLTNYQPEDTVFDERLLAIDFLDRHIKLIADKGFTNRAGKFVSYKKDIEEQFNKLLDEEIAYSKGFFPDLSVDSSTRDGITRRNLFVGQGATSYPDRLKTAPPNPHDTIDGTKKNDLVYGLSGNDKINALDGDDYVVGGEQEGNVTDNDMLMGGLGNDYLDGGEGKDTLTGYSSGSQEVDTLIGGAGSDSFVLADGYRNSARLEILGNERLILDPQDYALILDFYPDEGDVIQLKGSADQYLIRRSTILFDKNGDKIGTGADQIVGIVSNDDVEVNLNNGFSFF